MSKIFVSSDYHFNHNREFIYKPRGFSSIEEMNEAIIANHNAVVSPEDTVYLLGDMSLGGGDAAVLEANKNLIERLNGKIHIIRGNHDTDRRVVMYLDCKNTEGPILYADMLKYNGYHFYLSHFPTLTSNLEKETLKQMTLCLSGHTHSQDKFFNDLPYVYNVALDAHNCVPVLIDDIIQDMYNKVKECLDLI